MGKNDHGRDIAEAFVFMKGPGVQFVTAQQFVVDEVYSTSYCTLRSEIVMDDPEVIDMEMRCTTQYLYSSSTLT
jgi:hypothetical protein